MSTREQILKLFLTLDSPHRLAVLDELIAVAGQEHISNSDSNIGKELEIQKSENQIQEKPVRCPECASLHIIKWGSYKNQHRFRCRNCKHTFTDSSFNTMFHIHKRREFEEYGNSMFEGEYSTLKTMSKRFNICTKTAFNWRHKYLSSVNCGFDRKHFSGVTEIDDVWVAFNEKGREGKDDSRKRGGELKSGDNDWQVKVLFTSSRQGDTDISVVRVGRLHKKDLQRAVGGCFDKDSLIVCDRHPSIIAFAKSEKIGYESFEAKRHARDKVIHVQGINNMAQRFDEIINKKMNGVATKYLQNYASWFEIQEKFKDNNDALRDLTVRFNENSKVWQYFANTEIRYANFLKKYSHLNYAHPVKTKRKAEAWLPLTGIC